MLIAVRQVNVTSWSGSDSCGRRMNGVGADKDNGTGKGGRTGKTDDGCVRRGGSADARGACGFQMGRVLSGRERGCACCRDGNAF